MHAYVYKNIYTFIYLSIHIAKAIPLHLYLYQCPFTATYQTLYMAFYIHNTYLCADTHMARHTCEWEASVQGAAAASRAELTCREMAEGGGSPFPCAWGCVCTGFMHAGVHVCAPPCVCRMLTSWFAPVLPFGSRAAVPGCGHIRAALVQSGGSTMGEPSRGPSPNSLSSLLASHPVPMGRRAEPPVPGRGHVGRARAQPPAK